MLTPSYVIPALPPPGLEETPAVLRALAQAHRHLAELKGRAASIPNQGILIDTLAMQEAKASSEIENIVTTQASCSRRAPFPRTRRPRPQRRSRSMPTRCAMASANSNAWTVC